ncbi:hypothetical protein [Brevibacillus brevis]|uniref:Uncharacterized protein n=1 Tax=Brevibacillus brevis TaxID=1393 RepID=A0ABY9T7Q0_BREBE|nr:hypothetical protein [Brevibacillus brevis]WNC16130.1 hypothetical protein RGB73_07370 [Brevibacillus brevis]
MLRIVYVNEQGEQVVENVQESGVYFKEKLGEYSSERFPVGNCRIIKQADTTCKTIQELLKNGEKFIVTKIDTDGDGDEGVYTSLSNEDIMRIQEAVAHAK